MSRDDGSVGGVLTYLDLSALTLALLVGISIIAGVVEDQMAPFASVLYMLVQLLIFHASLYRGIVSGIFLSTGFLSLVVMGSMFRPLDQQMTFRSELLLDALLFYSLAILPGFFVLFYKQGLEELRDEATRENAKIRALKVQAQEMAEKKRATSYGDGGDERLDVRRGNSVAEVMRNGVQARSRMDLVEILARAVSNGAESDSVAMVRPGADGSLQVTALRPPCSVEGVIPVDSPILRLLGDGSRAVSLPAPQAILAGLDADVLLPIHAGGQVLGVVTVKHARNCDVEFENKYLAMMHKISQGLVTRLS